MPIFSSQLGKIESQNTEQSIKVMANHLRKIQEELEYRLMHLDSTNVSEIDASQTTIKTGSGDLLTRLAKDEKNYTEIRESVSGLAVKVTGYEETVSGYTSQVAEYKAAVDGYSASLQKYSEDVAGYSEETAQYKAAVNGYAAAFTKYSEDVAGYTEQTAQYAATVEGYSAKVSEYETTVGGYSQQVTEFNLAVGGFNTTVSNYQKDVEGYSGQVASLTLTAEVLQTAVQNLQTGMGHMLKLDENGLIVANQSGAAVKIGSGNLNLTGAISFGDLSDSSTYSTKINNAATAASNAASAASSAEALAEAAYELAESVQLPGYIEKTYIDKTHMRSPDIYGGMFYATGRGAYGEAAYYLYDGWHDPGSDKHGSLGLVGHNQVGFLSYDNDGAGTDAEAQKRVLLTSLNGTALKVQAAANMSLAAGGKIYVMSPTVFSTNLILTRGVNYGSSRPTTGTPGQLYFEIA